MKEFHYSLRLEKTVNDMLDKELSSVNEGKISKISKNNFISEAIFEKIQKNKKKPNCSENEYEDFLDSLMALKDEYHENKISHRIFEIAPWVKNADDLYKFLCHIQFRFIQKDVENEVLFKYIKMYFPEILDELLINVYLIQGHIEKIYKQYECPDIGKLISWNLKNCKSFMSEKRD